MYFTDLQFCASPTQGGLKWRGGALVQLGPTPTEPLGTQNVAKSRASLIVNLFTLYLGTGILELETQDVFGRTTMTRRSLHTPLRRPAHHATALPASAGVRTALGWLLRLRAGSCQTPCLLTSPSPPENTSHDAPLDAPLAGLVP